MTQPREEITYELLTQDEMDDMLAETLLAQERDLFMHRINRERFQAIIDDPETPAKFRERVTHLRDETDERLAEVGGIVRALKPQLPEKARLDAARTRIEARAEAARTARG